MIKWKRVDPKSDRNWYEENHEFEITSGPFGPYILYCFGDNIGSYTSLQGAKRAARRYIDNYSDCEMRRK